MPLATIEPSEFSLAEWSYLSGNLRMTDAPSPDRSCSIASADLLDSVKCAEYLDRLAGQYRDSSRLVTASLFAKRYGFLLVSASLYAMSVYDKGFDLAIGGCHVESGHANGAWVPRLRLDRLAVERYAGPAPQGDGERNEWRDRIIRRVFAEHLSPVWRAVSKAAGVPRAILWENTAIYVYLLYENRIAKECDGPVRLTAERDFRYMLEADPALFGERSNPLGQYYGPLVTAEEGKGPMRPRRTCCYYYQSTEGGSHYCRSCPKAKARG